MQPSFWDRLSTNPFFTDQTFTLQLDREQVERFYHPIADRLEQLPPTSRRRMVAIAGPPGSGKSSFAAILSAVINARAGTEIAVVVGQDGWHYSNAYLESHTIEIDGHPATLRSIKGRPETFDVKGFHLALTAMRTESEIRFPIYSRQTHEPAADAGCVSVAHCLVLVEGNYLLLDRSPWAALRSLFDYTIFLALDRAHLIRGLRERHARGGKNLAAIDRQIERVDLPDIDLVLEHSVPSDLLVVKSSSLTIERLVFSQDQGQDQVK